MKPKIGIIGFGFLGRALAHGFALHADISLIQDLVPNCNRCLRTSTVKEIAVKFHH